ncbi:hypothetical protein BDN70DRAFT_926873 [Pholiota conissans]|uniref:Uncharacterized protein n=1 Tax=Pholiota conissans TaxID=109636 RepID=A0A9P5ZEE4_9AGAR|nr:hypothetical protein BDN70DRAFT_926873 [Pholiota conissans]
MAVNQHNLEVENSNLNIHEQLRDLSSCGQVSQAFYSASRRYLFSLIFIGVVRRGHRLQSLAMTRIRKLLDILSENPLIQRQIQNLRIDVTYIDETLAPSETHEYEAMESEVIDFQLAEIGFDSLMLQFMALKSLTIHPIPGYSSLCTFKNLSRLFSSLSVLPTCCPNLHKLIMDNVKSVPTSFLSQWPCITDFVALSTTFTQEGSSMNDVMHFKRFSLRVISPGADAELLKSIDFGRLRDLSLIFSRCWARYTLYMVLRCIDNALPVLNRLCLNNIFKFQVALPISISGFPSLQVLDIIDRVSPYDKGLLPNLARFLTPANSATLNIRIINLTIWGPHAFDIILLGSSAEWATLDRIFSSNQYSHLTRVRIMIVVDLSGFVDQELVKSAIDNFTSNFVPLTHALQSVSISVEHCLS